jgi:hypothetical protein
VSASIERALAEVGVNNFTSNASSFQLVVSLDQKDGSLFHLESGYSQQLLGTQDFRLEWSSATNPVNLWMLP